MVESGNTAEIRSDNIQSQTKTKKDLKAIGN